MQHEREIDALLSDEVSGSIIDRLMTLPRPGSQSGNEWDRAVASRFEAQLAQLLDDLALAPAQRLALAGQFQIAGPVQGAEFGVGMEEGS